MRDFGFVRVVDGGFALRFPPVQFDVTGAVATAVTDGVTTRTTTVTWDELASARVEVGPVAHGARCISVRLDGATAGQAPFAACWIPAPRVGAARVDDATTLIRNLAADPARDALLADEHSLTRYLAEYHADVRRTSDDR